MMHFMSVSLVLPVLYIHHVISVGFVQQRLNIASPGIKSRMIYFLIVDQVILEFE